MSTPLRLGFLVGYGPLQNDGNRHRHRQQILEEVRRQASALVDDHASGLALRSHRAVKGYAQPMESQRNG